jgi:hypothetical protein
MMIGSPMDAITITDTRKITRTTEVFSVTPSELPTAWVGVKAVLRVHRKGIRYSKKSANRKKKGGKLKSVRPVPAPPPIAPNAVDSSTALPQNPPNPDANLPILAAAVSTELEPVLKSTLRKGIPFEETAYSICIGEVPTAPIAAQSVQEHWGIENKIHRHKDVTFNEDRTKIKDKSIAANLSQIFNFSLNLFTCLGLKSLKYGIEMYAHDTKFLLAALNSIHLYIQ